MDNILVQPLPTVLTVDGTKYEIRTDYRHCLTAILASEDKNLAETEKAIILLSNIFESEIPENTEKAFERCQYFISGGVKGTNAGRGPRLYSFSQDARLIFSAFKQTHGIDLQDEEIHWWKFLAYFADLGKDTAFCQLVSLRSRAFENKLTKEEKKAVRKMGKSFHVDQTVNDSFEKREKMAKVRLDYEKAKAKRNATT